MLVQWVAEGLKLSRIISSPIGEGLGLETLPTPVSDRSNHHALAWAWKRFYREHSLYIRQKRNVRLQKQL